jgi:membrane-bound lytic murein transglycosylase D
MNIKNKFTTFLLVASATVFGQEVTSQKDSIVKAETKPEIKISYLDSIKATFVNDDMATCIDSLWMKELVSLDVYNNLIDDIKKVDIDKTVDYELPTELLKERLKKLDEKSPFNIEYNIGLENVIKSFLKNRKRSFERLMGISQFYFPIFEEELAKNNIPLEIKYLAVVESALNPLAVSKMGATGLWQFMYQTGKQYGLNISSYVDERSDPLIASQAASKYMQNMYKIFGDWDLVLASYNSGPGNVAKAIRRSGGQQNYWNIRKNLPKETQGYLPAFLATMYIFEYHKEHGIVPNKAVANHFATDTVMVKKHMSFKQISNLLDIPVAELQFFNPSYKRNEIPAISGENNYLRLPKDKIAIFTSNEEKIYAYLDHEASKREKPYERIAVTKSKDTSSIASANGDMVTRTKYHKVRKGDNLSKIADKYNVAISDIKNWNGLRSNSAPLGRNLKILSAEKIAFKEDNSSVAKVDKPADVSTNVADSKANEVAIAEPKTEKIYKTEKVVSYKDVTKYHKVKKGDVLGEIATKYDVSVADLRKWNNIKGSNIGLGDNLKIVKNEKVTTTIKKEIKQPLSDKQDAIASVEPKKEKVEKLEKPKKEVKADTTEKSNDFYVVAKGDNLFSIAKKHKITIDNVKNWNNLTDNNVKVGTQLIVSNKDIAQVNEDQNGKTEGKVIEHIVGKGEYLGTIARKYNTTVNELLELNSLSDTNIKLGDKLIVGKEEVVLKKENDSYAASVRKAKAKLYQVKQGDTLTSISQKFPGVTIADIKKWNNIKGENLQPGMKLKIGG